MDEPDTDPRAFLRGGGECGALIDEIDWARTSLGPIDRWPAALRATVANLLHTRQPMLLFWGPELIQFYNDPFVPSFGQGKHPEAMGQPAEECWKEAWPVVGAQIEAVMRRGEPAWHEDALVPIHRNGRMEEVFWTYSYSPAYDDDGAIRGTLVVVTEMTGRVVAARRLETLSWLSAALTTASSHAAAFDALARASESRPEDLPFVVVCERREQLHLERVVGLEMARAKDISAQAVSDQASDSHQGVSLRDPVPGPVWPEPVSRVFAAPLRSVGAPRWLIFGLSPRLPFDDDYRGYLVQITEQLGATLRQLDQADASRAVEQQRDNLLLEAPVATALLVGPEHRYRLANPLYCKLVGRDPTGKRYLEAFPELADTELPAILDRVYETGEPFVTNEMPFSLELEGSASDRERFVNFNLEPLRDRGGRVYGMMAVAVDVTPQVRARRELEAIDAERRRVMAALQDANRAKDDFLAMLGHELRNPLAPIMSALELMKLDDADSSPKREMIERHVRHVIRLVDDLLDVARITRGKISLERSRVDVRDVVSAAVELGAPLVERRRHRVVVDVPAGIVVHADESRLVQVVSNLLTNAAHYTPEGGEIRIVASTEDGEAVVRVTDTGTGIAAHQLPHVFDLFTQGERSADRAEGGLGIGLALVKNLVEQHGGTVGVHSDGPGKGSELTIRLPIDEEAAVAPRSREAREPSQRNPAHQRVLLVDDNEDAAFLLGTVVRRRGYELVIATHPREALEIVEDFAPQVAVLDIGLPEMDGYQLAAELRTRFPACRLIALTGYGQQRDRERSKAAGFDAHLVKPVEAQVLLALLGEVARD